MSRRRRKKRRIKRKEQRRFPTTRVRVLVDSKSFIKGSPYKQRDILERWESSQTYDREKWRRIQLRSKSRGKKRTASRSPFHINQNQYDVIRRNRICHKRRTRRRAIFASRRDARGRGGSRSLRLIAQNPRRYTEDSKVRC